MPSAERCAKLTVPNYQRAYDWQSAQRRDLFDDLERLEELCRNGRIEARSGHFCGTIICTPSTGRNDALRYEVVDGQQRLTTLVLLHAFVTRAANTDPFVVSDERALFLPQSADENYFLELARGGSAASPVTIAQRNYADAATEIRAWLKRHDTAERLQALSRLIEERLQFIFFVLPNNEEVSKVFETINNRGKPLTQMDLVKNYLIYIKSIHDWDGDVESVWCRIQEHSLKTAYRGTEDVDTVLRAVVTAMFRPGRRNTGETDFKVVKGHIEKRSDARLFHRFLQFLEVGFKTFRELREAGKTGRDDPIGTQMTYLNQHPNISGVLPIIFARQFCRGGERHAKVLAAIEKANFRLYGLLNASKRSDSRNVALHTLAHRYFVAHCEQGPVGPDGPANDTAAWLIGELSRVVTDQHKDGFVQIVKALTLDDDETTDFHQWDALRYFLARWEEHLLENQSFEYSRLHRRYRGSHSNDYLALEHIYPSNSEESLQSYRDRLQLRRLGNFMLLSQGVNASLGDKPPAEKVALLREREGRNALLVQNARLGNLFAQASAFRAHLEQRHDPAFGSAGRQRFNGPTKVRNGLLAEAKTLCDLREEEMIRFALRAWRMPGEQLENRDGKRFLGLFSFRFEDETYVSGDERSATKEATNYVLEQLADGEENIPGDDALAHRLRRRNDVLGRDVPPVDWSGPVELDDSSLKRAA